MARRTPERREVLLEQVIGHLLRVGAADLSLRPLAAALGVSTFSLSYHFGTKAGLLAAVLQQLEVRQRARVEEVMRAVVGGPEVAVRAVWASLCDHIEEDRLVIEVGVSQRLPLEAELRRRLTRVWVDSMVAVLERGRYPAELAEREATMLTALLVGLEFDLLTTGERQRVDEALGHYADLAGVRWRATR